MLMCSQFSIQLSMNIIALTFCPENSPVLMNFPLKMLSKDFLDSRFHHSFDDTHQYACHILLIIFLFSEHMLITSLFN